MNKNGYDLTIADLLGFIMVMWEIVSALKIWKVFSKKNDHSHFLIEQWVKKYLR